MKKYMSILLLVLSSGGLMISMGMLELGEGSMLSLASGAFFSLLVLALTLVQLGAVRVSPYLYPVSTSSRRGSGL